MSLRFTKMHGLGNDFVVLDCRERPLALGAAEIRRLGDRHFGVGFDQLLAIERAHDPACAFAYGIWNADGSPAGQCGNGVRCVAAWLKRAGALGTGMARLQSPSGPVAMELLADGRVRAEMGEPRFAPADIPMNITAARGRSASLPAQSGRRAGPGLDPVCPEGGWGYAWQDPGALDPAGQRIEFGAVSMGNPHAVIEVADVATAPVATLGPKLEHAEIFPERCNVGFVQVLSCQAVRLRVWERGVGETLACGSGACAAVAVLRKRGKVEAGVTVALLGGELEIRWQGPGQPVWMTGPATFVFEGEWHD